MFTDYSLGSFEPQFEEPCPKRLGVGFSEVRAKGNHSTRQHDVARSQRVGQFEDFVLDRLAVVADRVFHGAEPT